MPFFLRFRFEGFSWKTAQEKRRHVSSPEGKRCGPREVHSEDWRPPPSWKPRRRRLGCRSLRQTDLQEKRNLRVGSRLSLLRSISSLTGGPMPKLSKTRFKPVSVQIGLSKNDLQTGEQPRMSAAASRRRIKRARRFGEITSSISHFFSKLDRPRRADPKSSSLDSRIRPRTESA